MISTIFKQEVIKNALLYCTSNLFAKSIPFFLLPVLTRYLSPSDYGIIAIFQVILAFMIVFLGLNSHGAIMANFFKMEKREVRAYVGNVFTVVLLNISLMLAFLYVVGPFLLRHLAFPTLWLYVAVLAAVGQVAVSIVLVLWQAEKKALSFGLFNVLSIAINAGLSLIFVVLLGFGWEGRILGIGIASSISALLGILILWKRGYMKLSLDAKHVKDILLFGVPLIPHALGGWIRTSFDKILITSMVGLSTTGVYAVGYQVGMVVALLATSFNTAWLPYLFRKLEENDYSTKIKIVKYTYIYCISILGVALLLGLLAPTLLDILVGRTFHDSSKYVMWIAMGFAFEGIYLVVGDYIFYVKKTYLISTVSISCSVLNVVLSYFFIRWNGALGAAQACFLTYFLFSLSICYISTRVYKMPWRVGFLALFGKRSILEGP